MSHRIKQFNSILERAIQGVLDRGFSDPRIQGIITVTGVDVAPDLRTAIVRITVLPEERENLTLIGLRSASRRIRRKAGELVAIHHPPTLEFRIDKQAKKQSSVLSAIQQAVAELEPANRDAACADPPSLITPNKETT